MIMKKTLLGIAALLALTGSSALAADLARPVYKAPPPPPPPVYSWTGCYVDGGGGYGMWNQDSFTETTAGLVPLSVTTTFGGRGWFGQVGAGCDYQIASSFLIGAFGDYDFMSLKGQYMDPLTGFVGQEKETGSWAVGGRLGYIALPGLLTYINGGYTQARFDQVNFGSLITGAPLGLDIAATTYNGWFLGGGTETSLANFFGLGLPPGLFLRSEYRYSSFSAKDDPILITATGAPFGLSDHVNKYVQTLSTSLVWKFNWASPVSARY